MEPSTINGTESESINYDLIHIDPVVVSKIVEHAADEGEEMASGSLVGLFMENVLEITNCFALPNTYAPRHQSEAAIPAPSPNDPEQYQSEMINFLRESGCDYLQLGFYQTVPPTASRSTNLVAEGMNLAVSLQDYNRRTGVNVALIYDPIRSDAGAINLKAFRLSKSALSLTANLADVPPELISRRGITYKSLLQEIPIAVKSPPLTSLLMMDIAASHPSDEKVLDIDSSSVLESALDGLAVRLDNLITESYGISTYARQLQRFNQQRHNLTIERRRENEQRRAKGEALLPEDITQLLPPLQVPSRLQSLVASHELNQANEHLSCYIKGALVKLQRLEAHLKK
ncbi:hypothetical protein ACOME3_003998 [Neoechinorhynchus agilis]